MAVHWLSEGVGVRAPREGIPFGFDVRGLIARGAIGPVHRGRGSAREPSASKAIRLARQARGRGGGERGVGTDWGRAHGGPMIATSRAAMLRAAMRTASGSGGEICCSARLRLVPLAGCLISGVRKKGTHVAALRARIWRIRRRFSQRGGESGRSLRLVREVSSPQLHAK